MKIKIKTKGGIAIDCRTNVYFEKDDVLEVGSKGLSLENLERLVEIKIADKVSDETESEGNETEIEEVEAETEEVEADSDEVAEPEPEYMSFTKKADLEAFAKEKYGIDLDKRLTIKGMIEQLENELGGEL